MDSNTAEEIFDVVDENDRVIGQAPRSECHSNPNLIHHTVHFTLINKTDSKILLTQRSFKKDHDAGKLCFLGEHILTGESYRDALIRGVTEELGFIPEKFTECTTHIFKYDKQTELIKFYIVFYYNQTLKWDKREMENIFWVDSRTLMNSKEYSEMTNYWIRNVDWDKVLKFGS